MRTPAIPSSLRKTNRRLILNHMWQVSAAARSELAEVAGTSCVTAGKIVDELLLEGVLEAAGPSRCSRAGRPSQNLRLNACSPRFVLVQVGVAHTRLAFAPLGSTFDSAWSVEIVTPATALEWETAVRRELERLLPVRTGEIWGVLLSVPGLVDETAGRIIFSPNCHWLEGVNFRKMFSDLTDSPVEVVQEIRALALGQIAASPGERNFLLVDFGHGVGAAAVFNGLVHSGTLPLAGELGHAPVPENHRICGCGSVGCIETLLSRRGLFLSLQEHDTSMSGRSYAWTLVEQHVLEHGLEPWLVRSLRAGAMTIAGAMNVLGLGRVVITGSLNALPASTKEYFAAEIRKAVLWGKFGEVGVEFASRHRMRGLIAVGIERLIVP